MNHIKDDTTVILCVVQASADIMTAEPIKLAREVDPKQERTFGILTKLDDFNSETSDAVKNVTKVLRNDAYKLALGYIGVSNRSDSKEDTV